MDTTAATPNSGHNPPRRRRSRFAAWFVLVVVVGVFATVTYGVLADRARSGAGLPDYVVYSDGLDGYAQAAELLRKLGWQPVAVTRPIQQTHHRGLLILAMPGEALPALGVSPALSQADVEGMLDWVSQGNTLLVCGWRNTLLHNKLGVLITDDPGSGDAIYKAKPGAVGEYTARIGTIALERPATVSGSKAVPLWSLGNKPAAVAVRHGKGRVLIVPDPSILTHRGLLREDNAVFLYNVAALDAEDGRVYFDEYHHGIRSGGGFWSYMRYHGQHWLLLQMLLVGGVAWWAVGRRLGPAVAMPVTQRADGVDYASSVARIYEKADARPLAAKILARHFLDTLTQHLRLRRSADSGEILATARQLSGKMTATAELTSLLGAAQDMILGRSLPPDQLLTMSQRFDTFLRLL
ncbi:MAG TPA: DUF4350 domain-containing protein [Gemmataceae bacterium]|nr:DUF4350 domain-containing protein [Gemmataceae bacterium]